MTVLNIKINKKLNFISLFLAIVFTGQVSLQALAESSVWDQRKVKVASLLNPVGAEVPSFLKPETLFAKPIGKLPSFSPSVLGLPLSHVVLQEEYFPHGKENASPIVLIQDVHLNGEAQGNIAEFLQEALRQNKLGLVGVEGAFAPFDFDEFRRAKAHPKYNEVIETFFRTNLISAPTYVGLTAAENPPPFVGVDDVLDHTLNVQSFVRGNSLQKKTAEKISALDKTDEQLKSATFSSALLQFDRARRAFSLGEMSLGAYVNALLSLGIEPDAMIAKFADASHLEQNLNLAKMEKDRGLLLEKLSARLNSTELADLMSRGIAVKAGQLNFAEFYRHLNELCGTYRVSLKDFPEFDRYLRYVKLGDEIKGAELLQAMNVLERKIAAKLVRTEVERNLLTQSEKLGLLRKLAQFSLTPSEWSQYQELGNIAITDNNLTAVELLPFEMFYREADRRSEKMIANLSAAAQKNSSGQSKLSALVVGGFHAPYIARLLREKKQPYLILSPKLTKIERDGGSSYLSAFVQQKTPLDRLLLGEKLFVSPTEIHMPSTKLQLLMKGALALVGAAALLGIKEIRPGIFDLGIAAGVTVFAVLAIPKGFGFLQSISLPGGGTGSLCFQTKKLWSLSLGLRLLWASVVTILPMHTFLQPQAIAAPQLNQNVTPSVIIPLDDPELQRQVQGKLIEAIQKIATAYYDEVNKAAATTNITKIESLAMGSVIPALVQLQLIFSPVIPEFKAAFEGTRKGDPNVLQRYFDSRGIFYDLNKEAIRIGGKRVIVLSIELAEYKQPDESILPKDPMMRTNATYRLVTRSYVKPYISTQGGKSYAAYYLPGRKIVVLNEVNARERAERTWDRAQPFLEMSISDLTQKLRGGKIDFDTGFPVLVNKIQFKDKLRMKRDAFVVYATLLYLQGSALHEGQHAVQWATKTLLDGGAREIGNNGPPAEADAAIVSREKGPLPYEILFDIGEWLGSPTDHSEAGITLLAHLRVALWMDATSLLGHPIADTAKYTGPLYLQLLDLAEPGEPQLRWLLSKTYFVHRNIQPPDHLIESLPRFGTDMSFPPSASAINSPPSAQSTGTGLGSWMPVVLTIGGLGVCVLIWVFYPKQKSIIQKPKPIETKPKIKIETNTKAKTKNNAQKKKGKGRVSGGILYGLKDAYFPHMPMREYAVKIAPWLENLRAYIGSMILMGVPLFLIHLQWGWFTYLQIVQAIHMASWGILALQHFMSDEHARAPSQNKWIALILAVLNYQWALTLTLRKEFVFHHPVSMILILFVLGYISHLVSNYILRDLIVPPVEISPSFSHLFKEEPLLQKALVGEFYSRNLRNRFLEIIRDLNNRAKNPTTEKVPAGFLSSVMKQRGKFKTSSEFLEALEDLEARLSEHTFQEAFLFLLEHDREYGPYGYRTLFKGGLPVNPEQLPQTTIVYSPPHLTLLTQGGEMDLDDKNFDEHLKKPIRVRLKLDNVASRVLSAPAVAAKISALPVGSVLEIDPNNEGSVDLKEAGLEVMGFIPISWGEDSAGFLKVLKISPEQLQQRFGLMGKLALFPDNFLEHPIEDVFQAAYDFRTWLVEFYAPLSMKTAFLPLPNADGSVLQRWMLHNMMMDRMENLFHEAEASGSVNDFVFEHIFRKEKTLAYLKRRGWKNLLGVSESFNQTTTALVGFKAHEGMESLLVEETNLQFPRLIGNQLVVDAAHQVANEFELRVAEYNRFNPEIYVWAREVMALALEGRESEAPPIPANVPLTELDAVAPGFMAAMQIIQQGQDVLETSATPFTRAVVMSMARQNSEQIDGIYLWVIDRVLASQPDVKPTEAASWVEAMRQQIQVLEVRTWDERTFYIFKYMGKIYLVESNGIEKPELFSEIAPGYDVSEAGIIPEVKQRWLPFFSSAFGGDKSRAEIERDYRRFGAPIIEEIVDGNLGKSHPFFSGIPILTGFTFLPAVLSKLLFASDPFMSAVAFLGFSIIFRAAFILSHPQKAQGPPLLISGLGFGLGITFLISPFAIVSYVLPYFSFLISHLIVNSATEILSSFRTVQQEARSAASKKQGEDLRLQMNAEEPAGSEEILEMIPPEFKIKRDREDPRAEAQQAVSLQMRIDALQEQLKDVDLRDSRETMSYLRRLTEVYRDVAFDLPENRTYATYQKYLESLKFERTHLRDALDKAYEGSEKSQLKNLNQKAIQLHLTLLKVQVRVAGMLIRGRSKLTSKAFQKRAALSSLQGARESAANLEEELTFRAERLLSQKLVRSWATTDAVGNLINTVRFQGYDVQVIKHADTPGKTEILVRQQRWINVHSTLLSLSADFRAGRVEEAKEKLKLVLPLFQAGGAAVDQSAGDVVKGIEDLMAQAGAASIGKPMDRTELAAVRQKIQDLVKIITLPKQKVWATVAYENISASLKAQLRAIVWYESQLVLGMSYAANVEYYLKNIDRAEKKKFLSKRQTSLILRGLRDVKEWGGRGFIFPKQFAEQHSAPAMRHIEAGEFKNARENLGRLAKDLKRLREETLRKRNAVRRKAEAFYVEYRDDEIKRRMRGLAQDFLSPEETDIPGALGEIETLREDFFKGKIVELGLIRADQHIRLAEVALLGAQRSKTPGPTLEAIRRHLLDATEDVTHKNSLKVQVRYSDGKSESVYVPEGTTAGGVVRAVKRDTSQARISLGQGWDIRPNARVREGITITIRVSPKKSTAGAAAVLWEPVRKLLVKIYSTRMSSPQAKLRAFKTVVVIAAVVEGSVIAYAGGGTSWSLFVGVPLAFFAVITHAFGYYSSDGTFRRISWDDLRHLRINPEFYSAALSVLSSFIPFAIVPFLSEAVLQWQFPLLPLISTKAILAGLAILPHIYRNWTSLAVAADPNNSGVEEGTDEYSFNRILGRQTWGLTRTQFGITKDTVSTIQMLAAPILLLISMFNSSIFSGWKTVFLVVPYVGMMVSDISDGGGSPWTGRAPTLEAPLVADALTALEKLFDARIRHFEGINSKLGQEKTRDAIRSITHIRKLNQEFFTLSDREFGKSFNYLLQVLRYSEIFDSANDINMSFEILSVLWDIHSHLNLILNPKDGLFYRRIYPLTSVPLPEDHNYDVYTSELFGYRHHWTFPNKDASRHAAYLTNIRNPAHMELYGKLFVVRQLFRHFALDAKGGGLFPREKKSKLLSRVPTATLILFKALSFRFGIVPVGNSGLFPSDVMDSIRKAKRKPDPITALALVQLVSAYQDREVPLDLFEYLVSLEADQVKIEKSVSDVQINETVERLLMQLFMELRSEDQAIVRMHLADVFVGRKAPHLRSMKKLLSKIRILELVRTRISFVIAPIKESGSNRLEPEPTKKTSKRPGGGALWFWDLLPFHISLTEIGLAEGALISAANIFLTMRTWEGPLGLSYTFIFIGSWLIIGFLLHYYGGVITADGHIEYQNFQLSVIALFGWGLSFIGMIYLKEFGPIKTWTMYELTIAMAMGTLGHGAFNAVLSRLFSTPPVNKKMTTYFLERQEEVKDWARKIVDAHPKTIEKLRAKFNFLLSYDSHFIAHERIKNSKRAGSSWVGDMSTLAADSLAEYFVNQASLNQGSRLAEEFGTAIGYPLTGEKNRFVGSFAHAAWAVQMLRQENLTYFFLDKNEQEKQIAQAEALFKYFPKDRDQGGMVIFVASSEEERRSFEAKLRLLPVDYVLHSRALVVMRDPNGSFDELEDSVSEYAKQRFHVGADRLNARLFIPSTVKLPEDFVRSDYQGRVRFFSFVENILNPLVVEIGFELLKDTEKRMELFERILAQA